MIFFIDCEWDSAGLISMALVSALGRKEEWYVVLRDTSDDPWVAENVIPGLHQCPPIPLTEAQSSLVGFLSGFRGEDLVIIADWPEDIAKFCMFMITGAGTRLELPELKFHLRFDLDGLVESNVPHNALEDARAIRESWRQKMGLQ